MSQFIPLVFNKNLIIILSIILLKVDFFVNCGPISKMRGRERGSNAEQRSIGSQFDVRRRDIFKANDNPPLVRNPKKNSTIIFEEPLIKSPQRGKVLLPDLDSRGIPTCLSSPDDTFCETVQNYPNTTIKQEIDYSPGEFLEIFGTKDFDGRKSYIDDDLQEERVCRRVPKVIYPQMAKNQANQWIYVVNEVEYTQAVVAEICEKEGKSCAYLDRNLPPGMYSRCRQKYSYKRLLALHPTEKRTYSDKFKFPSCCACYVKSNEILGRSLANKKRNQ